MFNTQGEYYLFIIKYFTPSTIDVHQYLHDHLIPPKCNVNHLFHQEVDFADSKGLVGLVKVEHAISDAQKGAGMREFSHWIRSITAQLNGVPKDEAEADLYPGDPLAPMTMNAIWSRISFGNLIKCFTFIGQPNAASDVNDYCIVPEALGDHLAGNALITALLGRDSLDRDKVGLLGGIGGHQGG